LPSKPAEALRQRARPAILVTHDIGEAIAMADRVVVMSRRPGRFKSDHVIRFATADGTRPAPFAARDTPGFNLYFNTLATARSPCRAVCRGRWCARLA
jgi:NitT/TauT family transport system ATP-binding protein